MKKILTIRTLKTILYLLVLCFVFFCTVRLLPNDMSIEVSKWYKYLFIFLFVLTYFISYQICIKPDHNRYFLDTYVSRIKTILLPVVLSNFGDFDINISEKSSLNDDGIKEEFNERLKGVFTDAVRVSYREFIEEKFKKISIFSGEIIFKEKYFGFNGITLKAKLPEKYTHEAIFFKCNSENFNYLIDDKKCSLKNIEINNEFYYVLSDNMLDVRNNEFIEKIEKLQRIFKTKNIDFVINNSYLYVFIDKQDLYPLPPLLYEARFCNYSSKRNVKNATKSLYERIIALFEFVDYFNK